MSVIKVTENNFKKEVLESDKPVLADFNADWCGPCRMLAPVIEQVADEHPEAKVVSINIDDEEELAEEYGITSIPCLIVFRDGKEYKRSVGLRPKDAVAALLGE